MRRALLGLAVSCTPFVGCGGRDTEQSERVPPARLVAQAADQMLTEGGAEFDAMLRATDGSFELRSRGRAQLGLLESHVLETFKEAPNENLVGVTNEVVYMRGLSYIRRPGEPRWLAYAGMRWGPADRVFYLPKVATALRNSGSERVLGLDTTRIDGVWDARRMLSAVEGRDRGLYRRQLRGIRRTRMPVTVWIDRRHRVRQLRLKADLRYLYGYLSGREGTETFRFRHFDSSINVEPPRPREIRNWAQLSR
jgi:hypothetical protein